MLWFLYTESSSQQSVPLSFPTILNLSSSTLSTSTFLRNFGNFGTFRCISVAFPQLFNSVFHSFRKTFRSAGAGSQNLHSGFGAEIFGLWKIVPDFSGKARKSSDFGFPQVVENAVENWGELWKRKNLSPVCHKLHRAALSLAERSKSLSQEVNHMQSAKEKLQTLYQIYENHCTITPHAYSCTIRSRRRMPFRRHFAV